MRRTKPVNMARYILQIATTVSRHLLSHPMAKTPSNHFATPQQASSEATTVMRRTLGQSYMGLSSSTTYLVTRYDGDFR